MSKKMEPKKLGGRKTNVRNIKRRSEDPRKLSAEIADHMNERARIGKKIEASEYPKRKARRVKTRITELNFLIEEKMNLFSKAIASAN
ncbi:TPA: hypothetical protein DDW69_01405 [candidate division CPR2 bacterium]|uniref:Uncharacterized protein n=1 Tax=candidate division CPR2 bacterium GW2011_GWC1_41_48 TaxID=1618344 RepID=A0A0G0W9Q0_UNCC2|nr:MAG: hypothetical protein UT47_C0001G0085 [candidate division CPR2 bacterium GW2011_GWC2_39_35]KKR27615.1 MAG: hypothetical protein UT60_C0044G0005 [candidate division CPR2 bacterium GW2011_GWD2_39_7]KKR28263.1 MAG: hypothetical protein UT59_C0031G0010 [candidate division CPR2 bacterium GW2011_GWD1_39_7]KKS09680.1 MAG: hypothetical protein UU65_C0001G0085 [candidate division CPR2 bacterium GW2011_GWC1_41_48]OGB60457.1 MAG: hypothetical protein A2Y27_01365 [candidate division CPR2 bacterium G